MTVIVMYNERMRHIGMCGTVLVLILTHVYGIYLHIISPMQNVSHQTTEWFDLSIALKVARKGS